MMTRYDSANTLSDSDSNNIKYNKLSKLNRQIKTTRQDQKLN